MHLGRTTLSKFLIQQLTGIPAASDLGALLVDVAAAVKAISAMTAKGALDGYLGEHGGRNVQGETQQKLDVLRHERSEPPSGMDYLQPGRRQVAAGYAIYGPATMLVITVGKGTHGFTLDREIGNFILTHPDLQIPADTSEFAINTSNARFWESPVHRYVSECQAGRSGIRSRDFNMRWIASLVAEAHRILMRGGVFMYPRDSKDPGRAGRLRLLYEANPIGLLIEQAQGLATTGYQRVMEMQPDELHQRVPLIMGSRNEVERIERYHAEFQSGADRPFSSPLFNERSLFRPEARL